MAVVVTQTAAAAAVSSQPLCIAKPREGEYIDLPGGKSAADVFVTFQGSGGENGSDSRRFAFWIEDAADARRHGPLNLLDTLPSEDYALRNIPEGQHRVRAALWMPVGDAVVQPGSPEELLGQGGAFKVVAESSICFHVRRFEDFVASYEWRPVEQWHRLPPGLDVVMDMGGSGQRKARIPEPWQWDAPILDMADSSGRRVVRVSVEADTTFAALIECCGLDPGRWEAFWKQADGKYERVMEASWTARQADLFRYQRDISIRPRGAAVGMSE